MRKLGHPTSQREALFRNLVTDLFAYGKIKTTEMAKEVRVLAEVDHLGEKGRFARPAPGGGCGERQGRGEKVV